MKKIKVGIVMLTYNRPDVVLPCLNSLVLAKTNIDWELYVIDNNSKDENFYVIKDEFEKLKNNKKLNGVLISSKVNHGFPKGNNFGIKYFLDKNDISHICLLNSDVIVTDNWLDKLTENNFDSVGPITNACGNEQTIPLPFNINLGEGISNNFSIVNNFSKKRYSSYENYSVETDFLGFFCFLAKREIFETVGFLDEQFGLGAYEDDDYCIHINKCGYKMLIRRDVFIYHWGSSSFSKIPLNKLLNHLDKNKELFEKKNGQWKDRKILPLKGFQQDIEFLLIKSSNNDVAKNEFELYFKNIEILFNNLIKLEREEIKKKKLYKKIKKAIKVVLKNRNILFLVRFPNNEDLKDGYFQRVNAMDNILFNYNRFYINYRSNKSNSFLPEIVVIKENVFEIRPYLKNPFHLFILIIISLSFGRIYSHSILTLRLMFNRFLFFVSRKKILDIHGVVPEEFRMHEDLNNYKRFNKIEKFAVKNATIVIGVTKEMAKHIIKKYNIKAQKVIVLPILPEVKEFSKDIPNKNLKSIIYCGGLQKWQQVDKMLEYVYKNNKYNNFAFLVPDSNKLIEQYKNKYNNSFPGIVESVESDMVAEWYKKYSFGLVLREDIIVNNAACPTKLIEYFQNDVVPIVDTPNIGDFKELGYAYVEYEKELPNQEEWVKMITQNREVLKKIYKMYEKGLSELKEDI